MPEFDFFQGRFNLLPVKYEIKKQKPENESWLNRFLSQYKKCNSMEMELQKPYAKDLSRWINLWRAGACVVQTNERRTEKTTFLFQFVIKLF